MSELYPTDDTDLTFQKAVKTFHLHFLAQESVLTESFAKKTLLSSRRKKKKKLLS